MKKISYAEAKQLINSGNSIKCLVSRTEIPVRTLNDLENLNHLANEKVQSFELFYETTNISIPDNAQQISIDDAITLLHTGETICYLQNDSEIKISSQNELLSYYRSCHIHGDKCTLYRYVA